MGEGFVVPWRALQHDYRGSSRQLQKRKQRFLTQGDPLQAFLAKLESVRLGPLQELEASLTEAQGLHVAALSATTARAEKDVRASVSFCQLVPSSVLQFSTASALRMQALLKAEACAERASAAASRPSANHWN